MIMRIEPYNSEIEAQMRNFYQSLSEKDRRRYAAIEAKKLGYGGISYIRRVLNCDNGTITRGMTELESPLSAQEKRLRQSGGGRKSVISTREGLDEAFLGVLENHTAGSPVDEKVKWTNLTRETIAERLKGESFDVSVTVVDQLLKKHHFRRRQAFKSEAGKQVAHRDEQFQGAEAAEAESS